MSTFACPSCQRSFAEAGFCPYDGSALASAKPVEAAPLVTARELAAVHTSKTAIRSLTMPQFGSTIETAPPGASSVAPPSVGSVAPPSASSVAPPSSSSQPEPVAAIGSELPTHRDQLLAAASPAKAPQVRAISAAEETDTAVSVLGRRGTIYDQLVGQTLDGRYYIERKIGEGGMGVVYSARHAVIERPLAIKVLKKEALRDSATITRFVQEAKAASRIGHPNIVDVTDFGTTPEGLTYSVMEYVKGTTLAMVIKTAAPLPVARAAAIGQQLARALGAAHDKGIVHRDLKPENIFLVERDGQSDFVKIVDFGIAKVTPIDGAAAGPRLTRAGSVFGTPEYMAPEQAAGRSDIDGRVDVYALGVILYEAVTGRLPLKGDSPVRTIAMQLLDPVVPPRQSRPDLDIGEDFEAIIMKALAKRRDERFRTMSEFQTALEQLLRQLAARGVMPSRARGAAQPVVGLAPLPPGADPRLALDSVHIEVTSGTSAPTTNLGPDGSRGVPMPSTMPPPRVGEGGPVPALPSSSPPGSLPRSHRPSSAPPPRAHRPSSAPPPRAHRPSEAPPPRAHRPSEAPLAVRDEPEFVKTGVSSFEHVYLEAPPPPRPRRWLLVGAGLLMAGAAGAAVAVTMRQDHGNPVVATAADARLAEVGSERDAASLTPSVPEPPASDAGDDDDEVAGSGPAAGKRDGGGGRSRPGRRKDARTAVSDDRPITVQILTYPTELTSVYRGRTYRGPHGTQVVEPYGTVARFTCTKAGYHDGYVDVKFDDNTPVVVCIMKRKKVCVDDLKNPYDDCPDAGPSPKSPR